MKKISVLLLGAGLLGLSSCNDFLDRLPDDRAEVNDFEKATQLVSSAYSTASPAFMMEWSSDNVTDNGKTFYYQTDQDQVYRWKAVNTTGNDDPQHVWGYAYYAVGNANQALEDLGKVKSGNIEAVRAEALLCRAWAVFSIANAFCMAYDESKATSISDCLTPRRRTGRWTSGVRCANSTRTSTPTSRRHCPMSATST